MDVCGKNIPDKGDSHAKPSGRSMPGKPEGLQGSWRGGSREDVTEEMKAEG